MNLFKKAYDWASTYDFKDIDIEYASKLALKMLDDSCQMNFHDREVFFNIYDALCDRADINLDDDVNHLIKSARDRKTIYSKPQLASIVHACKEEIIPNMLKVHMKAYKAMVKKNLGIL
jgi:alpha-D-ribose 1-methylphosphonate 5-triphosphate diphosphatase PhnM